MTDYRITITPENGEPMSWEPVDEDDAFNGRVLEEMFGLADSSIASVTIEKVTP